jgi:hypothetical protein
MVLIKQKRNRELQNPISYNRCAIFFVLNSFLCDALLRFHWREASTSRLNAREKNSQDDAFLFETSAFDLLVRR